MKLALGTAQFGSAYGVTNKTGQVKAQEVHEILKSAKQAGIDTVDTAVAYGESESVLGAAGLNGLKVVTKLPSIPGDLSDVRAWIREQVNYSLARLKAPQLYGLLLHRSQQLVGEAGEPVVLALEELKAEKKVEKIGVSIYSPVELEGVTKSCSIDLVQAPINLLDRRLKNSDWLSRLKILGIEIHARSVFLQGLLLMPPNTHPTKFLKWQSYWERWHNWLSKNPSITPVQACLQFVLKQPEIDRVVVGVDSHQQLLQLVQAIQEPVSVPFPDLCCSDEMLLHPSNWERL